MKEYAMTKRIILAVSGSISAYKSADLTSKLKKKGYDIHVIMTESAQSFITPLTLQALSKNPVHSDVMEEKLAERINHIDLAKKTDLFIVAPASANTIAKLAHGMADNMLTATALALPSTTPKLIAPAMNTKMYENPLTKKNLKILQEVGYQEILPKSGLLACGDTGRGALADISVIIESIDNALTKQSCWQEKKFMMNKKNKANQTAQLALLIATMVVIEVLSQTIFAAFALPIKPTLTHIPVIIASIVYGPKIGAYLGGFMGIMSIVRNTIVYTVGSYLFSPFVEGGTWASAVIAIVPRILIGIFPYFIYKLLQNRLGLTLSGVLGAFTNTFFVLLGIYFLIPNFYSAGGKTLMATIFTINSVAEMVIAGLLTLSITPMLLRLKK